MAGVKALRKIQLGRETTAGTAVAATTIFRGVGTIEDQREVTFAEEDIGYLSGVDRTYTAMLKAALVMDDTEATYEQLPHICEAGIMTATPTTDGSGSDYVYTYNFPTTAANTIKTYTIEGGDNQAAEEMEYSFVESFKLSGSPNEALMMSANWLGRQVSSASFTTTATLPTVSEALFNKGKLYIDTTGGTVGTTQKTQTWLGLELNVTTGLIPKFTADGNLYFTFPQTVMSEITADITFEHDATSTALKTDWAAETARLFSFRFPGAALQTAGSTYSTKMIIFDMAGKVEKVDKLDEIDGNDVLKMSVRARYNSTAGLFARLIVVNELSALP